MRVYPHRSSPIELRSYWVRGEGGSSEVTQLIGDGVTLTRTGTGAYRLTWAHRPGEFKAALASLQAATPGDLAGHTVVFDEWDADNLRLDFVVYNASDTAHDLAADEYVSVEAVFGS